MQDGISLVFLLFGFFLTTKESNQGRFPKSGPAASGLKQPPSFHHRPKAPLHKAFSYTSKNKPDSSEANRRKQSILDPSIAVWVCHLRI